MRTENTDLGTVKGFGREWATFDQAALPGGELQSRFDEYFRVFRWDLVNSLSVGFDMGCGSGRWDQLLAPRVGHLHCIEPSAEALDVARRNLKGLSNVTFHNAGADSHVLPAESMDFGVSLGVLHHVPDTKEAIRSCVKLLKIGAPLLLYLYYRFDNRPAWFRSIWEVSNAVRLRVSRLPFQRRRVVSEIIAATVYWPLSRTAGALERMGMNVDQLPLSYYRNTSYYTLRTDALDRFGTRLEHRFTRDEVRAMMEEAGCEDIRFSDAAPYWCVCGVRRC